MPQEPQVVIITGSSGLIGSAICRALESQGVRTLCFDRPGLPHPPEAAEAIDCDISDPASVEAALREARRLAGPRIASVIHLAAYYDFSGQPSPLYDTVTVNGTRLLVQFLHRLRFQVEQFLFSSTMLVHAPVRPGQRITEDSPLGGTWAYPQSKIAAEEVLRAERGEFPIVLHRLAGVYDDLCHSPPLANQIQRIYERDLTSYFFPGDTDAGQAFVHLDDTVESVVLCIRHRRRLPPVMPLLIGEEPILSYRDLQNRLGELIHGRQWQTFRIPKAVARVGAYVQEKLPGPDPFIKPWMIDRADDHYALDTTRARQLLGWQPVRSLEATLPLMVEKLLRDPAEFYRLNKLQGEPPMAEVPAED